MKNVGNNYRKLEIIIKGFANHRRLQILELLAKEPEMSVGEICEKLEFEYLNTSDHIRRLFIAGLVLKRSDGKSVRHKLTPRAQSILSFCKNIE